MAHGWAAGRDLTEGSEVGVRGADEGRYSAATIDHFQHPRNVGRLEGADGVGRVDDVDSDTMVEIYVKVDGGRVTRATFRTFGCSACIAASSIVTELLIGRHSAPTSAEIDAALGGLPDDKRYCVDLVAEAAARALSG